MMGVPVVCSDHCGAKDLLQESWRGEVFRSGSVDALQAVLARWIERGKTKPAQRERILNWSRCLDGEVGAGYILAVVDHVYSGGKRPELSWLRHSAKECSIFV